MNLIARTIVRQRQAGNPATIVDLLRLSDRVIRSFLIWRWPHSN